MISWLGKHRWPAAAGLVGLGLAAWAIRGACLAGAQFPELTSDEAQMWLWRQIEGIFRDGDFSDTVALWAAVAAFFSASAAMTANRYMKRKDAIEYRPGLSTGEWNWHYETETSAYARELSIVFQNGGKLQATDCSLLVEFCGMDLKTRGETIIATESSRIGILGLGKSSHKCGVRRETLDKVLKECGQSQSVEVRIRVTYFNAFTQAYEIYRESNLITLKDDPGNPKGHELALFADKETRSNLNRRHGPPPIERPVTVVQAFT